MKNLFIRMFVLSSFLVSFVYSQNGLIKKFNLENNDLVLTRAAQPHQYMDKIGDKAALMGFENGVFELWIWPWKVLRGFDLQFFVGTTTQPILSKDIVRDISVTPEATVITFVYESFTVKEIIFVPRGQTAAIILLDIHTTTPLAIVPGFMPVMQPQWPAGIGGQYSYWDDEVKAYVISEAQRRGLFLCGSPVAQQMAAPPAHMFADNPIQFKIEVKPSDAQNNFIPIILAGSPVKTDYASVKTLYRDLAGRIEELYKNNFEYYRNLRDSTLSIETPDKQLNLAFEYGKVALRNLMVENPNLGRGLVAGYGLSGGGGRPGFAWYFGGDAFINCLAMNSFGDYRTVKDALTFTQKWQRQDNFPIRKKKKEEKNIDAGKMAHELSQSDGLIDWWNDYHYGYNHADTTPWYLVAMSEYIRASGDLDYLKKSWKSILQAYEWCKSKDSNGDGLMDLKGAGLGVLEFGALVKIFNDNYTQSIWTKALKEVNRMAKLMGDAKTEKEADALFLKALAALEKIYWLEDLGYYSFGAAEDGTQVRDKNIYSSTPIMFGLYDKQRSEKTIEQFNESDMITDWGVRNLSNKSSLYEPANYNYGAVWPFTSFFIAGAQFATHYNVQGLQTIKNTAAHIFNYGLGIIPEVFSGDINTKLGEAYHNQGFSVSGFAFPMVQGLLGLEIDALNNRVVFTPKLPPNWRFLKVKNIRIGDSTLDFELKNENGKMELISKWNGKKKLQIEFSPDIPIGSEIISVINNDKSVSARIMKHKQAVQPAVNFDESGNSVITINYKPSVSFFYIGNTNSIGELSDDIRIISQEFSENAISLIVEVRPNIEYQIGVMNFGRVEEVIGAELKEERLLVKVNSDDNRLVKRKITLRMK